MLPHVAKDLTFKTICDEAFFAFLLALLVLWFGEIKRRGFYRWVRQSQSKTPMKYLFPLAQRQWVSLVVWWVVIFVVILVTRFPF